MSKNSEIPPRTLLAIGAHPDDIEFGCGGVLLEAARAGWNLHLLVCTKGEASSRGTPVEREAECQRAAEMLGAQLRFIALESDAHLQSHPDGALALARVIREVRPAVVFAPTTEVNQHPDHIAVGTMVRNACRFARFGGLEEIRELATHRIEQLLMYAVTPAAEPRTVQGVRFDISAVRDDWEALMRCHASQLPTLPYVELQIARARTWGLEAGVEYAQTLFPNDPLLVAGLDALPRGARTF